MPAVNKTEMGHIEYQYEVIAKELENIANKALYVALKNDGLPINLYNLSNHHIRLWYQAFISALSQKSEEWKREGLTSEEQARWCFEMRHRARLLSRDLMSESVTGKFERKLLEMRDYYEYGNVNGPTFDYLKGQQIAKCRQQNKLFNKNISNSELLEQVYQNIINSSLKTNDLVNRYADVNNRANEVSEQLLISEEELEKYLYYRYSR